MTIFSAADEVVLNLTSELYHAHHYSGPSDREPKFVAAKSLMGILSNPEQAQAVGLYPRVWALDNITREVYSSEPVIFDAAKMLVALAATDECAIDTDNRTAGWATQQLRMLANAADGTSRYETTLRSHIDQYSDHRYVGYAEKSARCQIQADEAAGFQHQIFGTALGLFADETQTGGRKGSKDEGSLLRSVLNGMAEGTVKEQARIDLRETLVNVAINRPKRVEEFLKDQFEDWRIYAGYLASPADRLSAKQGMESFSLLAKAGRWIEDVTDGLIPADRHPESIASLAELRKERRPQLSILAA